MSDLILSKVGVVANGGILKEQKAQADEKKALAKKKVAKYVSEL